MQVKSISSFNINNTFKSNSSNRSEKYMKYLEKKDYIDRKLEKIDGLSTIALIAALLTGAFGLDFSKKLTTTEKISVGLAISAFLLLGAKWIKELQLSKQYDKEHNNDTKSNAEN